MPFKDADDRRRCMALYRRRKVRKDRMLVLAILGGQCCHCGFDDERALQIDHVQGNGRNDRHQVGGSYFACILKRIRGGSKEYQLLCANCNAIKKREMDEVSTRKYPL